eukprot:scaffold4233_cov180-Ochromonas_danica.AAC.17
MQTTLARQLDRAESGYLDQSPYIYKNAITNKHLQKGRLNIEPPEWILFKFHRKFLLLQSTDVGSEHMMIMTMIMPSIC